MFIVETSSFLDEHDRAHYITLEQAILKELKTRDADLPRSAVISAMPLMLKFYASAPERYEVTKALVFVS